MPRSQYSYVVTGPGSDSYGPWATFTVKRELIFWLQGEPRRNSFTIWRCRDNQRHTPVEVSLASLGVDPAKALPSDQQ
jgi:hypothetical protein